MRWLTGIEYGKIGCNPISCVDHHFFYVKRDSWKQFVSFLIWRYLNMYRGFILTRKLTDASFCIISRGTDELDTFLSFVWTHISNLVIKIWRGRFWKPDCYSGGPGSSPQITLPFHIFPLLVGRSCASKRRKNHPVIEVCIKFFIFTEQILYIF